MQGSNLELLVTGTDVEQRWLGDPTALVSCSVAGEVRAVPPPQGRARRLACPHSAFSVCHIQPPQWS